MRWLLEDDYHHHRLHKNTEEEALALILQFLSCNFSIEYIRGRRDDKKLYYELDVKSQLNINADTIATKTASLPVNTRVVSLHFELYINNRYTYYRLDHSIRVVS